jgi:hypothetical protein
MRNGLNYRPNASRCCPDRCHCSAGCPHLSTHETLPVVYAERRVEHQPHRTLVPCCGCTNAILAPVVGHTANGGVVANELRVGHMLLLLPPPVDVRGCKCSRGGRGGGGGGTDGGHSCRQRGCCWRRSQRLPWPLLPPPPPLAQSGEPSEAAALERGWIGFLSAKWQRKLILISFTNCMQSLTSYVMVGGATHIGPTPPSRDLWQLDPILR